MRRITHLFAAALLGLGLAAGASRADDMLHSFEGGTVEGFAPAATNPHVLSVGALGATNGVASLQVVHPGPNTDGSSRPYSGAGAQDVQAATDFLTYNTLSVDVTRPNLTGAYNAQVVLTLSYKKTDNTFPFITSENAGDVALGRITWNSTETGTKTLVWNFGDDLVSPLAGAGYFFRLGLRTRTNGTAGATETLYFDNFRFSNPVPEPGALCAVGLAAVGLTRRSRRGKA